jgi:Rnl2 family RNA ligase
MKFTSYCDIENSYRQKALDYIVQSGLSGGEWCVNEKLHGSNSAIITDGISTKRAKRGSVLGPDENFYGIIEVAKDVEPKIKMLYDNIKKIKEFEVLQVCGEIFGGWYPHPDVPKSTTAIRVQKGIYYSPNNMFYAFDIMLDGQYQNYDLCVKMFEEVGLFYASILFRGTLQECLDYPNMFQTTIPDLLGLPKIENNVCEGVVIKPIEPTYLGCGSRVILKNKNEKWSENLKKPKVKTEITFSEAGQEVLDGINELLTENRLKNVLSKIGEINDKQFGILLGMFIKDVFEEYGKENSEKYNSLSKEEHKRVNKMVGQLAGNIIRPNFQAIIDKNF